MYSDHYYHSVGIYRKTLDVRRIIIDINI